MRGHPGRPGALLLYEKGESAAAWQGASDIAWHRYLQRMHQGNQGERHMFPNAYARQVIWQWMMSALL